MMTRITHAIAAMFMSASLATAQTSLQLAPIATLEQPWAMAALPQGGFLVTHKAGRLSHVSSTGDVVALAGAPRVAAAGQVGLHDVALAPDFNTTGMIYLTWVDGANGGALHLGRGQLDLPSQRLVGLQTLWQASPLGGRGHPGAMIAFDGDGHLFLTSGDRQLGDPAQDLADSRGKILRFTLDGEPARGNPFATAPDVWTYGNRNPYGLAFDATGQLWSHEMGPRGGDELNLIEAGSNYGWPLVSEGRQYSGRAIPEHATRPDTVPPAIAWTPVIAPSGMAFYAGGAFPQWQGSLLIGGLASEALVRVEIAGTTAREVERWDVGNRIRDVAVDDDGAVYLLEDGTEARLLRVLPAR